MKNWKTTLLGWIAGIAPIIIKILIKSPVDAGDITLAAAAIGLGTAAADASEEHK